MTWGERDAPGAVLQDGGGEWDSEFEWSDKVTSMLRGTFNLTRFRPLQSQVINCFLARRDSFVLLPTGGGKSLCYQLPALLLDGVSVIISPLVSLMHDQVEQLKAMGIHAAMLSASSSKQDVAHLHDALVDDRAAAPAAAKGPLKLAYVTPERIIKSKVFLARLERAHALGRIAAFVVDEAHCCRYSVYWLY